MIIRKLFKFENAHIVRNCSTSRCKYSLHGHSYKVELLLESKYLDGGQMIYDFGLLKGLIKELIDSFDHSISLWNGDDENYIKDMQKHSLRWIILPISPSAEQLSRIILLIVEKLLAQTKMVNNERAVSLNSVIIHETDTGYAQAFKEDAHSLLMGKIDLKKVIFSKQIKEEWRDKKLYKKLLKGKVFKNKTNI
jgi:6-pyruvoyltetrahydropterin/6-carboxytetrahydropterin synthase